MQEACTRWSGKTEPIVPVPTSGMVNGWWQQVVQLAGVEAVVKPEHYAPAVAGTVGVPLVPLAHIDEWRTASSFTVHPSCIDSTPEPTHAYVLAAEKAPLWQVTVTDDLTHANWLP